MEAVVKHRTALNLVHRLTTASTTTALSTALSEIRLLSKRDPDIRSPLADSGIVPVLTHFLLQQQPQSDDDASDPEADLLFIQENALATLLNLSISSPESLMSAAPSLIPSLSLALRGGGARHVLAQHAAATLYCLLSVDAYRPIIGSKHDQIVAPLISLIRSQTSPTRTLKDALKALFALALYPLNRPPLVQLGAVPALFSLVGRDGRAGMVEDASAVIAQVAGCYESVEAFRAVGGVRVLAGMAASNFISKQRASGAEISLDVDLEMEELKKSDRDSRELRVSFVPEMSSDSSDEDARSSVHRRGRSPVSPQKEGGAGSGEVLRCTSFRRPSGLLRMKTKSRLMDPPVVSPPAAGISPPAHLNDDKKSGVFPRKSGQLRSGILGIVEEDDDDPFHDEDIPDDFKNDKFGKFAILEFVGLILILIALACSLSIRVLQRQTVWKLHLWKWEVMVLALICGRLFSNLIIRIMVYLIERNFLLRKRVLYFVYGIRNSVQNCLWLGIVLLTWHYMLDRKVARETHSEVLYKVTRVLVCLLLTTIIWLVKTLLVKVLASSFHVSTYFDRIQESLFNQYVIKTLSGPPLVEIQHIKEEEDRVFAEFQNFQNAGANVPNDLRAAALGARSGRAIGRSGHSGARNSMQSGAGKSMRLSGGISSREISRQDPIPIDQLHKLNQKNVSAWNMKRLMKIVRNGTLYTLDEQLNHEHGTDESELEIKSEFEAKIAARKIFRNVARPGSKYIYLADLMRFLREDEARKTMSLFDVADENGRVSRRCLKNWVVNAFRERRALALTLNDTKTAVNKLHQMANVLVAILVVSIWLLALDIASTHFFVFMGSQVLVAVFMFGNTLKMVFEAIIFLFVMHPFDVGDRCEINGVQMIVEEMNILTTVFLRFDNQKITYPNTVLATLPIGNFYRSPDMGDSIDFCIHVSTPLEKIAIMKERIIGYMESKKEHWYPGPAVVLRDVDDMNRLKVSIWMRHHINFQDMGARWDRRELVVREMIKVLKELDVEYRMLPVDVNVRDMPAITSARLPSNWTTCSQ